MTILKGNRAVMRSGDRIQKKAPTEGIAREIEQFILQSSVMPTTPDKTINSQN